MLSRMEGKYHLQNNLGTKELSFEFISQEEKKKEGGERRELGNI